MVTEEDTRSSDYYSSRNPCTKLKIAHCRALDALGGDLLVKAHIKG